MNCNTSKCKEITFPKKNNITSHPIIYNISQHVNLTLLGVTVHSNCSFAKHVKTKQNQTKHLAYMSLHNKRTQERGRLQPRRIDHFFNAIVIPKIEYGLPVYGACQADLNPVCFLNRCFKSRYSSKLYDIHELLEK